MEIATTFSEVRQERIKQRMQRRLGRLTRPAYVAGDRLRVLSDSLDPQCSKM